MKTRYLLSLNPIFLVVLFYLSCLSCSPQKSNYEPGVEEIQRVVSGMTELMVKDVTNPPLAARFFAYTMLAGYEVTVKNDSSVIGFKQKLNAYPDIKHPEINNFSWKLAAIYAMLETASGLQPSGKLLEKNIMKLEDSCARKGMDETVMKNSKVYGSEIAKQILAYAKSDGYRNISSLMRYSPSEKEGSWYPTPPGFFPAVEPYFNSIRSFTLDSASQFLSVPPAPYASDRSSPFYKLMHDVFLADSLLTNEQKIIASFWDCNPFALEDEGHLKIGIKKISPGAHWMGIAGIVCKDSGLPFGKAMEIHAVMGITLTDAFITCWDEKYRSNRIRPETAIRKMIDPSWRPFLQTPPFPEYLSGHSVISTAAAEILTNYFGNEMPFIDTVELPYGLPPRSFKSFRQAADEAAISRFYGGIHFMDAITAGQNQGLKVGANVLQRIL